MFSQQAGGTAGNPREILNQYKEERKKKTTGIKRKRRKRFLKVPNIVFCWVLAIALVISAVVVLVFLPEKEWLVWLAIAVAVLLILISKSEPEGD